jgi:putative Mg2+ transporter-C (MgtC) family protein
MHLLQATWFWTSQSTLTHLLLAVFLGVLIGAEREWRQRSAGLRTNALVCLGAAAFVDLSMTLTHTPANVSLMIQYIVSGVGFLGAGAIMKEGATIRGLNTAATLWCSAAVGATASAGRASTALTLCLIVIGVNLLLRPATMFIDRMSGLRFTGTEVAYVIRISCAECEEARLRAVLLKEIADAGLTLHELESANSVPSGTVEITAHVTGSTRNDTALERLSGRISLEGSVTSVRWTATVSSET